MKAAAVAKYFRRHPAEPLPCGECRCAVVIPACDETAELPATLEALFAAAMPVPTAVIVVVNHPAGVDDRESLATLELLRRFPVFPIYLPNLSGGVGAARRAGMDAFVAALPPEKLEESAIFSLDADTTVEADYFSSSLPEVLRCGAATFGFRHKPAETAAQQAAIDRYEAYLRRYAAKLREVGSPYAFVAIGSAFAVRCDVYLRCGGMKVREAGEDFYFLQAAAKVSSVRELPRVTVHPSPRVSHRVPFGTGPAVASLLAGKPLNEIGDEAFDRLREVLKKVGDAELADAEKFLAGLPAPTAEFFRREGFVPAWNRILGNLPKRPAAPVRAFHEWFDGLKTLRFLHFYADFS